MMISRMLSHITYKLSHFDLIFKIPFKASENDLSLPWFEAIYNGSNGSMIVFIRKVNELLINKFFISD